MRKAPAGIESSPLRMRSLVMLFLLSYRFTIEECNRMHKPIP
ncbi:hypothetical protein DKAM_0702 [Desulfurococcus amylolyticus 1221n]|uniref:Uncharacterized protein n=1 Tax=Desulfurococcus amylolyticus (strain DSM 18924 / JCM 16383 / VKM B-2413 / 1221n) TaxID=490899 RepID=B8D4J7_DESA1|nr:hypothetical protein DKAM_0702 [Desulfurococcus amylolyticus 1221n]